MNTKDIAKTKADLKEAGFALLHYDTSPIHSYPYDAPWLTDANFNKIFESIRHNTLVDRVRCYSHYMLLQQVRGVPGDILEIGTWRGGTAGILTQISANKTVYLADTFKGVVKSSDWEHYKDQAHSDTTLEHVTNFLSNELKTDNYKILEGIFPEETGGKLSAKNLAYVHIDVDVYQSAKDSFDYIWHRVSPSGIVVFDDYGFMSACSGIKKFIDEIKDDDDKLFIHNLNGHAYIIKR